MELNWIKRTRNNMPLDGQHVLAFIDGRIWTMSVYGSDWYYDGDLWDGEKPSHWMPLPAPPSEQNTP